MHNSGREGGWAGGRLGNLLRDLKRVCGMPDYPGYLQHMADRHPGSDVLSERQFFEAHLQARYGTGVTRCC